MPTQPSQLGIANINESLLVLYLQEFDGSGANAICQTGSGYTSLVFKVFGKLRALDGHRKAQECISMREALPKPTDDSYSYRVNHEEWFNENALAMEDPGRGRFVDTTQMKVEENQI